MQEYTELGNNFYLKKDEESYLGINVNGIRFQIKISEDVYKCIKRRDAKK